MTTRGQLFNGEMVRAILDDRKTETRRPITKSNSHKVEFWSSQHTGGVAEHGGGGMTGFDGLDWGAHRVDRNPLGTPCTPRCSGRDYCGTFVDGDPRDGGEYLHVPGVGGETRQRVRAHVEPGDQLYVRETHAIIWDGADHCGCLTDPDDPVSVRDYCPEHMTIEYRADTGASAPAGWDTFPPDERLVNWTPSIHMPKALARINLRVTSVHAEQVQEITDAGALAEGVKSYRRAMTAYEAATHPESCENGGDSSSLPDHRATFARLWDSIYADRGLGWQANAWCWVVKFQVMT